MKHMVQSTYIYIYIHKCIHTHYETYQDLDDSIGLNPTKTPKSEEHIRSNKMILIILFFDFVWNFWVIAVSWLGARIRFGATLGQNESMYIRVAE